MLHFYFLNWLLGFCGVIMNFCRAFESEFSFFFWFLCIWSKKKKFNVKDRVCLMSLKMLGFMSYIVGVIVCLLFFFRH